MIAGFANNWRYSPNIVIFVHPTPKLDAFEAWLKSLLQLQGSLKKTGLISAKVENPRQQQCF